MLSEAAVQANAKPSVNQRRNTLLILSAALLLRIFVIFFVLHVYPRGWFFLRGTEMSYMAKAIVEGHGLSSPFGVETGPTAMFAPLYPMCEALVFYIFGSFTTSSAVILMLLHSVANLVTIWLMMKLARNYFSEAVAVVAGTIWTFALPLWWLPTILWDTSFTICLLMGLLVICLRVQRVPKALSWVLLGTYSGLVVVFNPALLLAVVGVFAVTTFYAYKDLGRMSKLFALSSVLFLIVYCGWPIRNAQVFHAFVPLRTALGLDLWMGNHEGSSGYLEEKLFPTFNKAELAAYQEQGEIAYTDGKMAQAKTWMKGHPATFALLTGRRVLRFWMGTGTRDATIVFPLYACMTSAFGLYGLFLLVGSNKKLAWLLAVPLLLFPLPYYVSHAEFRFRLVVDPILTLSAAYAVVTMYLKRNGGGDSMDRAS